MSGIPKLFPDGHFYSPLCDPAELRERKTQLWPPEPRQPPWTLGIDFRIPEQLELLTRHFSKYAADVDFPRSGSPTSTRYVYENDQYPGLDAEVLFCMLRHLRPRRVIEVGSGYSTLVTAEVNRRYFDNAIAFTCVEPYPRSVLRAFLDAGNQGLSACIEKRVQSLSLDTFTQLGQDDILVIDSSHVCKTGSDVNHLILNVLPMLAPGVVIHFHDIWLPDEYPFEWAVEQGRNWNEQYLLQAFLQFNDSFEVVWSTIKMDRTFSSELRSVFPERFEGLGGGGSFWIRRKLSA